MASTSDWPDAASSVTLPNGATVRTYKLPDARFERYVGLKYERNDKCKDTKSGIKVANIEVKGSYKLEVAESKWMPTPKKDGGFGNWTLKQKGSSESFQLDLKACELAGGYVFEVKVTLPASKNGFTAAKSGSTFAPASRVSPTPAAPASVSTASGDWRNRLENPGKAAAPVASAPASSNKAAAAKEPSKDWRERVQAIPKPAPAPATDWRSQLEPSKAAAPATKAAAAAPRVGLDKTSSLAKSVPATDWRSKLSATVPSSSKTAAPPKANAVQPAAANDWRARLGAASTAKAEVPAKATTVQPAAANDWRARLGAASSAKAEVPSKAKAAAPPKANAVQPAAANDWRARLGAASPAKAEVPAKATTVQPAAATDWRARLGAASPAKAEVPSKAKAAAPPKANAVQPAAASAVPKSQSKSTTSGLRVTGAGDARVNGEYVPDPDVIGGDPTFRMKTDKSVKVYKLGGTWKMVHSETSGYLYIGTGEAAASATWVVGSAGKAPFPRVSTAVLR